jgi:hypothetical protein
MSCLSEQLRARVHALGLGTRACRSNLHEGVPRDWLVLVVVCLREAH